MKLRSPEKTEDPHGIPETILEKVNYLKLINSHLVTHPKVWETFTHFLQNWIENPKGKLLYLTVIGSRRYGLCLNDDDADVDFVAIYQTDPRDFFGLSNPSLTWTNSSDESQHKLDDDITTHELKKFGIMLAAENPTAIELLWGVKQNVYMIADEFLPLLSSRGRFITVRSMAAFRGFGMSQFRNAQERIEKGKAESLIRKSLYHAVRGLYECIHILNEGRPHIFIKYDNEHRVLMQIRKGTLSIEETRQTYQELLKKVDDQISSPHQEFHLPTDYSTNNQWLENWMVNTRLAYCKKFKIKPLN
mmetsp:Transcript_6068/g.8831  ORF Transcript_6068/g.8831 Transcript_6068/m.8831 type:complete len:304 (+) Transcript_6068:500-1411(+)